MVTEDERERKRRYRLNLEKLKAYRKEYQKKKRDEKTAPLHCCTYDSIKT